MKKLLMSALVVCTLLAASGCGKANEPAGIKDGIYTETAKGNNGDVKVEVEVKDEKVIRVEVVEHSETAGIADLPIQSIPAAIVDNQSLNIDTIDRKSVV